MKMKLKSQNDDAAFDSLLQEMEVAQYAKPPKKTKPSHGSTTPSIGNSTGKKKAPLGNGSSSSTGTKQKRKGSFEVVPLKKEDLASSTGKGRGEIVSQKRTSSSLSSSGSSTKPSKVSDQTAPKKKARASTSPGAATTAASIPLKGMAVVNSLGVQEGGELKRPRDEENGGIDWTSHRKVRKAGDPLELWASDLAEETHTSTRTLEPVNAR